MKLTSVKHNHSVKYPDKYEVDINRMLLKYKPARWNNSPAAKIMLGALIASQLTGCASNAPQKASETTRKMNMAPIFEEQPVVTGLTHRSFQKAAFVPLGNYPGPDMTPLSEDAALTIIGEVLKSNGIGSNSSKKKVVVGAGQKGATWSFDLNVNGAKEPIYIEFIPAAEAETKNELSERESLNLSAEPKEAAYALRERLGEVRDESTGAIFYSSESMFSQEDELREQVNEFVTWLKTTGLI